MFLNMGLRFASCYDDTCYLSSKSNIHIKETDSYKKSISTAQTAFPGIGN